jgi:hypothetical protein
MERFGPELPDAGSLEEKSGGRCRRRNFVSLKRKKKQFFAIDGFKLSLGGLDLSRRDLDRESRS